MKASDWHARRCRRRPALITIGSIGRERELTAGQIGDQGQRFVDGRRRVGGAEFERAVALVLDRIERDDDAGAGDACSLNGVHADAADAHDHHSARWLTWARSR